MKLSHEKTTTLTITLTPYEARRIMGDFDQAREPSAPGKVLYAALAQIVKETNEPRT